MGGRGYHVTIEAFEGPFDLLLHLIAQRRLEVWQVPLAEITDDYLRALDGVDQLDLETATGFLEVAAALVELKAARLLPGEGDEAIDELAVEVRDLLYARLIDYRTFKAAAGRLRDMLHGAAGHHARRAALEERFRGLRRPVRLDVGPDRLAALAGEALARRARAEAEQVDLAHIEPVRLSLEDAVRMTLDELDRAGGRLTFAELTAGCRHPSELVAHFLALLELHRLDRVALDQQAPLGSLRIVRTAVGPIDLDPPTGRPDGAPLPAPGEQGSSDG